MRSGKQPDTLVPIIDETVFTSLMLIFLFFQFICTFFDPVKFYVERLIKLVNFSDCAGTWFKISIYQWAKNIGGFSGYNVTQVPLIMPWHPVTNKAHLYMCYVFICYS